MMYAGQTLVDLLRERARDQGDQCAFRFLEYDNAAEQQISYAELDRWARSIAARLIAAGAEGERVLLLYPPGFAYIAAFFGCLYAGAIAVPAYPPRMNRNLDRLQAVVNDATARIALTTEEILARTSQFMADWPALEALQWIAINHDTGEGDAWRERFLTADSLAFLQYTSGSTGNPKGVMLTHRNLLENLEAIRRRLGNTPESVGVSWVPPYHDMGLIMGILQSIYVGFPTVLMAPASFVQRPLRWLEAISHYRGTYSCAPNFAYELCMRKVTPEEMQTLDLSSWTCALNGAEPIRRETLERFVEVFGACGFRREAHIPAYGLAESTVFVSGIDRSITPLYQVIDLQRDALERHELVEMAPGAEGSVGLVGCGRTHLNHSLRIVHPETCLECPPDQVGEVWVSGPSVGQGYWQRTEETEQTFRARIADTGEGPFLRTGDLGFIRNGELYITGRMKELVIIRGRNYYPQDFERIAEAAHSDLRPGCGAAFSVEANGEEQLVIVYEVNRRPSGTPEEIFEAIRRAVAQEYDLQVYAISLIQHGSLPKTSSGKIQRRTCRAQFLERRLTVVAEWVRPLTAQDRQAGPAQDDRSAEEIRAWLIAAISRRSGVAEAKIQAQEPFASYGLDSVQSVEMLVELEGWLGRPVSPSLVWDYPTPAALAAHLAGESSASKEQKEQKAHKELPAPGGNEPIAVVGLGCRFPGAPDPARYWEMLCNGVDAITEVPPDRWDVEAFYDADPGAPGKMVTRWGGFLEKVDEFDPDFFGITPREATGMDPQQRLLLEVAWEALEDAGIPQESLAGSRTGVFVGISSWDYAGRTQGDPERIDAYTGSGVAHSIAANRISYLLDLRGPSMAIDTACSSSLVAIHLACQSLRSGECSLALVGGVNLILKPDLAINFSKVGALATDGRCKTFDSGADGYVRSEGAGVAVLKPLSQALADGDPVYAVIRGSAVNQDGRSNGLMSPNGPSQEAVLREAYRRSGISPEQVQYVEAHGTGTALGDLIEAQALGAVMAAGRPSDAPLYIGSAKTNLGHLEAAAGIAGFMKAVLALKHGHLPPSLHLREPNPHIPWATMPLRVPISLMPWPVAPGERAAAGVSSFGFGGTNCHVVVEAPPPAKPGEEVVEPSELLVLSARAPGALREQVSQVRERLAAEPSGNLHDLCYSAARRRSHHPYRAAFAFQDQEELLALLDDAIAREDGMAPEPAAPGPICFVFSGQGSQWWGMGRQLMREEPLFRAVMERCDALFRRYVDWSLVDELMAEEGASRLDQTAVNQPVLFAMQIALTEWWRTRGITPDRVVGHSFGEVAAACVAGALTLEEGVKVIAHRSRLMQRVEGRGRMAVVELSLEEARRLLQGREGRISVAAENSPDFTVLSGDPEALSELMDELLAQGIFSAPLPINLASHSPQMESLRPELEEALADLKPRPARLPVYSTVTGELVAGEAMDATYWGRNLRETVRFGTVIAHLAQEGCRTFVEVSPHPILLELIQRVLVQRSEEGILVPSLWKERDERRTLLSAVGTLYTHGYPLNWEAIYPKGRYQALPPYPWQRQRYDLELLREAYIYRSDRTEHALPGRRLLLAAGMVDQVWEIELGPGRVPGLAEPIPPGQPVPETFFRAMAEAAAEQGSGTPHAAVELAMPLPLVMPEKGHLVVQLLLSPDLTFRVFSRQAGPTAEAAAWSLHASGRVSPTDEMSRWFYGVVWHPQPLEQRQPVRPATRGSWLILADGEGLGHEMAGRLERDGERAVLVRPGAEYRADMAGFQIHPGRPEMFAQLLADAFGPERPPCRGIIHLWNLEATTPGEAPNTNWESDQLAGCGALIHLLQALEGAGGVESPRLFLVTRGTQAVGAAHADLAVAATPLWGLGGSVALELPKYRPVRVDLDPANHATGALYQELWADSPEDQIAFRSGIRHVARLERAAVEPTAEPVAIRPDGTYLITGGLSGIGLFVAQQFVERGARHLILLARRTPSAETRAVLDELRARGVRVAVANADVAEWDQLASAMRTASQGMPPLRGIIHAAGIFETHQILDIGWERFASGLRPKVGGAWNLHLLSREERLDFFVMLSSAASVLGLRSHSDYAAANAFLDGLAVYRRALGLPAFSLGSGLWSEIGWGKGRSLFGMVPFTPDQGFAVLERLLSCTREQLMVAQVEWERLMQVYPEGSRTPLFRHLSRELARQAESALQGFGTFRRQLIAAEPGSRQEMLQSHLRNQFAQILGYPAARVSSTEPLNRQGLDSLIALEFRSRVEREFGVSLSLVNLLRHTTLVMLAEEILRELEQGAEQAEPIAPRAVAAANQPGAALLEKLDQFSDTEVNALLQKLINQEGGDSV